MFFKIVIFSLLFWTALAESTPDPNHCQIEKLKGSWHFYKFRYEGNDYPPISPDLVLKMNFDGEGNSSMRWRHSGQKGFCARKAKYVYKDCFLMEEVTWVHPENRPDCGTDPDMREGRISLSPVDFAGQDLRLHLKLSGQPLIYYWKPINEPSTNVDLDDLPAR